MADASTSLTPDIQRALQEAIGNANEAAHLSEKKKKRSRDEGSAEGHAQQSEEPVKKKKSKKRRVTEGDVSVETADEVPTEVVAQPEEAEKKKKRKKSKDKHRAREDSSHPGTQIHLQEQTEESVAQPSDHQSHSEVDLATSSADFLSAVVAAASATSHVHDAPDFQQPGPSFVPFPDHFPSFSPQEFPYAPPMAPHFGPSSDISSMFPDLDLSLTSSEDLLRTLQDLDITKIASVLKTLGEASVANGPSAGIPPSFLPLPLPPGPPPVNQVAAKSDAILGRPPKQVKESGQNARTLNARRAPVLPPPPLSEEGNPDHAHMLANVWMNASKLSKLAQEQGLVYKKGKFSAVEDAQLEAAIESYRVRKGLTTDDLVNLIFTKDRGRDDFWVEIASALHLRPIISVYHHVRRLWHPLRGQGKWMPCEDAALRTAVAEYGQSWEKVSECVGRSGPDCRDRYRNHLEEKGIRTTGPWTKEEEEELTRLVTELIIQEGKDSDNDIFWGAISKRMGGRRGKQQCRIKWLDSLSGRFKNDGKKLRWSELDAYILVHKIDSLDVHDDTEIDWKKLPDEHWNSWSSHALQRRWMCMKRGIKGHEEMSHAEIMDILRTKKAQSPQPPSNTRSHKKITSAETIMDSDEEDAAGSSTGPGTAAHEEIASS